MSSRNRTCVALLTDHGSHEGSNSQLATAVECLTGTPPVSMDARHFMSGGNGSVRQIEGNLTLEIPSENVRVTPSVVLIYEIPPGDRRRFAAFQRALRRHGAVSLGTDADAWRNATEKGRTIRRFLRDGIRHMPTIEMVHASPEEASAAFEQLGRDVWARPTVGSGGQDVFHITTDSELRYASEYYAKSESGWLVAQDAQNFNPEGRRHQFRVVVLGDRVLRVCEHVQADPDAPCNEIQGAVSTELSVDDLSPEILRLAVRATQSLGLSLGGVDLAVENDGVVFEVNVHPVLDVPGGLETVAIPYVEAHLALSPG